MTQVQNRDRRATAAIKAGKTGFLDAWVAGGSQGGRGLRRRITAILRLAHSVLGMKRDRLGLGTLGAGTSLHITIAGGLAVALLAASPAGAYDTGGGASDNGSSSAVAVGNYAQADSDNIAIGYQASAQTGSYNEGIALGVLAVSQNGGIALGSGAHATVGGNVAIGGSSTATSAAVSTPSVTIAGVTYTFAGGSASSVVSVGNSSTTRQIQYVGAGRISSSSTDAINGSQLFAVIDRTQSNSNGVSGVVGVLGGTYNPAAGTYTGPTYTLANGNTSTVQGGLTVLDTIGSRYFVSGGGATGTPATASGTNALAAGVGATASTTNSTAFGPSATAAGVNAVAVGPAASASSTSAVAFGASSSALATNALALGSSANASIANSVALGASSSTSKAVNVASELLGGNTYFFAGVNPTTAGVVSVGSGGSERQIQNVAAGRLSSTSTDAVNGSQLYATNQQVELNTTSISQLQTGTLGPAQYSDPATPTVSNGGTTKTNDVTLVGTGGVVGLHNVRDGVVALGSSDAITGGQLFTTNQSVTDLTTNVSNGSLGPVQRTGALNTLALVDATGTGAAPGALQTLTNVAPAALSAGSNQAVNGSQLFATNSALAGAVGVLGGTYTPATGTYTGPTYTTVGGGTATTVQGALTNYNTYLASLPGAKASPMQYSTAAAPTTANPGVVSNDATLVGTGSAPVTLHNVAAGALSPTSTDAVNGTQLNATNLSISNITNGTVGVKYFHANSTATDSVATGLNSVAIGPNAVSSNAGDVALGFNATTAAPVATAGSTIGGVSYTYAGAAPTSVVSVGKLGAERQIQNVAAGQVTSTSTDAINGSQLFATNKATGNNTTGLTGAVSVLGGTYNPTTGTYTNPTYTTVGGGTATTVQGALNNYNTYLSTLSGGGGTAGPVQYSSAALPTTPSGTQGNNATLVGTGSSPVTLHNLAPGALSTTSSDAVTGAQLFATSSVVNNITNGAGIKYFHANSSATDSAANGLNSVAIGPNAVANNAGDIALGFNSTTAAPVATAGSTIGGVSYTYAGNAPTSAVSVGLLNSERQIQNVAAGQVTSTSTDAINGSQLFATNKVTGNNTTGLTGAVSVLGGSYNPTTGAYTGPTYTTAGGTATTVQGALTNLSTYVSNIGGSAATVLRTNNPNELALSAIGGTGSAPGAPQVLTNVADGSVAAGSMQAVNGEQLYATNQAISGITNGGGIKYFHANSTATDSVATGLNSVAIGPNAVSSNAGDVALGFNATTAAPVATAGSTIGGVSYTYAGAAPTSVVSVGKLGAERQIQNVAAGQVTSTSTDAINGSQLFATNKVTGNNTTGLTGAVSVLGGTYNPTTGTYTNPTYTTVGGGTATTVQGALNNYNTYLSTLSGGGGGGGSAAGPVQYSSAATPTISNGGTPSNDATLVGVGTSAVTLHNVAAGALSTTSTDAVNGTQLNATNLTVGSLTNGTAGPVQRTTTADQLTLVSPTGTAAAPGNAQVLANVADGALTAGSKQAVNGEQLYATNQSISNITSGTVGVKYFHANSAATDSVATGLNSVAIGPNAVSSNTGDVALGFNSITAAPVATAGSTIGGVSYTYAGNAPTSAVSVGKLGAERQIQNVAAGQITKTSTDAINGSQLFATNTGVSNNTTGLTGAVSVLGGSYNPTTGAYTGPTYTTAGGTATTVQGALTNLSTYVSNIGGSAATVLRTNNPNELALSAIGGTIAALGAPQVLSNVADGTVAAGSKQAVNGEQLYATNQSITNITNGGGIKYFHSGSTLADSVASGTDSLAIGGGVSSMANYATTIGTNLTNMKARTVLIGVGSSVGTASSVAIGDTSVTGATGTNVAIGSGASAVAATAGGGAVAIGVGNIAIGDGAVALGDPSVANGQGAIAQGFNSIATSNGTASGTAANGAVALGDAAIAAGQGSVSIGNQTQASNAGSIALGDAAAVAAAATRGVALGSNARVSVANSVALGANSTTTAPMSTPSTVIGGTTYTYAGGTPSGVVSVGSNGAERVIQNVAAGRIAQDSTDAVTGTQLFATNSAVASLAAGKSGVTASDNTANAAAPSATGTNALASGFGATAAAPGATALGNGSTAGAGNTTAVGNGSAATGTNSTVVGAGSSDNGVANSTVLGSGASIAPTVTAGSNVALGQGSTVASNAVGTKGTTLVGSYYAFAGDTPAGALSVGSAGQERVITNVAAGSISSTSTDAVNGSQLYSTNTALTALSNSVGNVGKYSQTNSTGPASSATGPDSTASGPGASASGANSLANGKGASASGTNGVAIGSASTATLTNSVALGSNSTTTGASSIANNGLVGVNSNAGAITPGSGNVVSVGSAGAERQIQNVAAGAVTATSTDATNGSQLYAVARNSLQYSQDGKGVNLSSPYASGAVVIHNLAPGVADTDAANVSQLKTALSSSIQYDLTSTGTKSNTITLQGGDPSAPVRVTNLAPGAITSDSSDAVRGSQLYATNQAVNNLSNFSNYLNGKIDKVANSAYSGIATAMAASALRYDSREGKLSAAGAFGTYHGRAGIALGVGQTSEDGRLRINAAVSFSPNTGLSDVGIVGGLSYTFN